MFKLSGTIKEISYIHFFSFTVNIREVRIFAKVDNSFAIMFIFLTKLMFLLGNLIHKKLLL